ncbi:inositol monophosphatase family protein [Rhodococcus sp. W8901]|uniref:inositol monophosphatase family protein n=1 Tax=Rhodococcus sp. W8901 TaxID=2742603 RepID=UPI00158412FC|nr:inositol monophosphatase [Rhodococcus sp. W8901]QKT11878.1 inositol monophosphatase [Rhodococcus sp. W8901]
MSLSRDPLELLAIASDVLDGARDRFVAGLGAPSAVRKGPKDFATAVDLELEKSVSAELERRTGIEVHGEEFGGPELTDGDVWILDPIDGTFNYSAGLPTAGMLLALLRDGVPVLGLTWLPLTGERFAAAVGGPVTHNGLALPPLERSALSDAMIGFGAFNIDSRGRIPGTYRFELLGQLSRASSRLRMHGSTGADLAYTAAGILGGAVVFGHHVWDNAAGVALVRAAGGVVTDLRGDDWHVGSRSVLAAAPGVHGELLDILHSLGDPENRPEGGPQQ